MMNQQKHRVEFPKFLCRIRGPNSDGWTFRAKPQVIFNKELPITNVNTIFTVYKQTLLNEVKVIMYLFSWSVFYSQKLLNN